MEYFVEQTDRTHNLPLYPTPFIGREEEIDAVAALLDDPACRLLTLCGPGGMGKTRLAIEVASRELDIFSDGVWYVSLQSVESSEVLLTALADALTFVFSSGQNVTRQLLNYLYDKHLLLVLDNFEQLLPERGETLLSQILISAPQVHILVTSREVLNLQEEWLYPVQGMPFPEEASELAGLNGYSAVQLFVERARRVRRDFSPDDERDAIARICRLVEGMPLALELAAAWTKTLRCAEIAGEIQTNLDFLATNLRNIPERHRSIQAVFEHSWRLLSPDEQAIFMRLSVFRGGFGREAAEQVAAATLPVLSAMVDKSMLRQQSNGRYEIHELLRQFAAEHLVQSSPVAPVYDRHAAYYTEFLAQRLPDLVGGRQYEAMREIKAEDDNIRVAWNWAVDKGRIDLLEEGAEALALFYRYQSRHVEMLGVFQKTLVSIDSAQPDHPIERLRFVILMGLVWTCIRLNDLDQCEIFLAPCLEIINRIDDLPLSGYAANPFVPRAGIALLRGDYTRALELADEALRWSEARGHASAAQRAMYILTRASRALGMIEQARHYAQQTYTIARDINDHWFMAYGLSELGNLALESLDYIKAQEYFTACLSLRQKIDDPEGTARALASLGEVAFMQERFSEAQSCYQQSWTIYRKIYDREGVAISLYGLGNIALHSRNYSLAQSHFLPALDIVTEVELVTITFPLITGVAELLLRTGRIEPGVKLLQQVIRHPASTHHWQQRAARLLESYAARPHEPASDHPKTLAQFAGEARTLLANLDLSTAPPTWLPAEPPSEPSTVEPLSQREREVLGLIAEGLSNQEIADRLYVGVSTVKKHINHIYDKLGVANRTQALYVAHKQRLI